ncbi:helix-turn-helix domain-containing protein [Archangium primigenium]|uniref:helix-turn-helix domain-containing protein n=1 Tax=[Archangium] primigenium TaxID=2792470 RepID=UPI00195E2408|nr:helix-turn-helix transcriptional regulator [Archangium primigenium]MBM7114033.1 helix-turn-helix transcriptional regulator [Archangium primigenium]
MRSSSPSVPDPRVPLQALARRIRALRERRGLTQEDFASRCGISVSFASLLERGERGPSSETLVQAALALGVPLAELFRTEEDEAAGVHRLVDFARERSLSRAEVDQMLEVARVLFGAGARAAPGPAAPEPPRCRVEACGRVVLARGLCGAHYHRERRAVKATRPSPP